LGQNDVLARYGGEEFVILFIRAGKEEALRKAESLRKDISKLYIRDNIVTATVTASFGISSYPEIADSELDLIRSADAALYKAKSSGRNCVVVAESKQYA
jgi:diguanylate cyclase (GGDEF)-like protein